MPQPTMIRKLKNGMTTGGQFSGGMLSESRFACGKAVGIDQAAEGAGSVIAYRCAGSPPSGQGETATSPAGFSSFQRPSIAAILAG